MKKEAQNLPAALTEKEQQEEKVIAFLLEHIEKNSFFNKSIPAFDADFLRIKIRIHGYNAVRVSLNELYGWILEDPLSNERKNYRKTLGTWLKRKESIQCPKCGYNAKRSY